MSLTHLHRSTLYTISQIFWRKSKCQRKPEKSEEYKGKILAQTVNNHQQIVQPRKKVTYVHSTMYIKVVHSSARRFQSYLSSA